MIDVWYMKDDKYSRLSNLAQRRIEGVRVYNSVEHAYQSNKTGAFDKITYGKYYSHGMKIRGLPPQTKNNYNIRLMEALIKTSFIQNPLERDFLISTRPEVITHEYDRSIWKTEFPRILMELREYFYYN